MRMLQCRSMNGKKQEGEDGIFTETSSYEPVNCCERKKQSEMEVDCVWENLSLT